MKGVFLTVVFEVVEANLEFTGRPCTAVRKEGVVFLTQRRQATSDFRENTKVKLTQDDEDIDDDADEDDSYNFCILDGSIQVRMLGSNCGRSCTTLVMKHNATGVASVAHFDNHTCWQVWLSLYTCWQVFHILIIHRPLCQHETGNALEVGLRVMLEEVEHLASEQLGNSGVQVEEMDGVEGMEEREENIVIQVSIFGGAMLLETDDYARNSMALLRLLCRNLSCGGSVLPDKQAVLLSTRALQESCRTLDLVHCCVGQYNTEEGRDGKPKSILSGAAV